MIFFVSLGSNCQVKLNIRWIVDLNWANDTRKKKLKQSCESFPLDYLVAPDLELVLSSIENKFENLIDKKYFITKENEGEKGKYYWHNWNHPWVFNTKYKLSFIHHFGRNLTKEDGDFDKKNLFKDTDTLNKKFNDRGEKFFDYINKAKKVYFMRLLPEKEMINPYFTFDRNKYKYNTYKKELDLLQTKLKILFPNINYEIKVFTHRTQIKPYILSKI